MQGSLKLTKEREKREVSGIYFRLKETYANKRRLNNQRAIKFRSRIMHCTYIHANVSQINKINNEIKSVSVHVNVGDFKNNCKRKKGNYKQIRRHINNSDECSCAEILKLQLVEIVAVCFVA